MVGLAAGLARAELWTLTDTQGRSIRADVISVDDTNVTIRRADGQEFTLALEKLTAVDQARLREWAKEQASKPQPLPAGALRLTPTKIRVSREVVESDVRVTTGDVIKNGRTDEEAKWGYKILLENTSKTALSGLRAEYRLYVSEDNVHVKDKLEEMRVGKFAKELADLPAYGRVEITTDTMLIKSMRYRKGITSAGTGESRANETLVGIWMRIYRDNELVHELITPERLRNGAVW